MQARQQPAWSYEGGRDQRHLHRSGLDDTHLKWMMELFNVDGIHGLLASVRLLMDDD